MLVDMNSLVALNLNIPLIWLHSTAPLLSSQRTLSSPSH